MFQKIWSMIQEPLFESHVASIFIHNIHPKLKFIALYYMILTFIEIMHMVIQKEKFLIGMGDLKYGNTPKDTKEWRYHKNEYKWVHAI